MWLLECLLSCVLVPYYVPTCCIHDVALCPRISLRDVVVIIFLPMNGVDVYKNV